MAVGKRVCKVCGKEYESCYTVWKPGDGNRWQDVACSPDHAAEYFANIAASRKKAEVPKEEPAVETEEATAVFAPDANEDEPKTETTPVKKPARRTAKGE